jgi:hypothetical protein
MCSVFKAFSQCSLADLAHAISVDAYSTSKDVVDSSATERIVKSLRNSELTEAVLRRHPLVLDFHRRHLVCTSADSCRDAWCSHPNRPTEFLFQSASFCRYNMLHDLFDTAGVDVGDADRRRVYLVCLECAKQPFFSLEYTDLFLGRTMHILFNQYNQIEAPMTLIDTAARLHLSLDHPAGHGGCSFSIRRHSVARASLKLWPAQRIRVMFGCTATACHRLAVAPASLNPHSKKSSHFKTRILVRVMGGYLSKVQVQQQFLLPCGVATTPSHVILYYSNAPQQTRDTRKFFGFDAVQRALCAFSSDCSPIPSTPVCCRPSCSSQSRCCSRRHHVARIPCKLNQIRWVTPFSTQRFISCAKYSPLPSSFACFTPHSLAVCTISPTS